MQGSVSYAFVAGNWKSVAEQYPNCIVADVVQ